MDRKVIWILLIVIGLVFLVTQTVIPFLVFYFIFGSFFAADSVLHLKGSGLGFSSFVMQRVDLDVVLLAIAIVVAGFFIALALVFRKTLDRD